MVRHSGHYLGTEVDEKWFKHCTGDGLLMRGNGAYWHDEAAFCFQRYSTEEPIVIPFDAIIDIKLGTWHSGRWAYGNFILKLVWERDGQRLGSGFIVGDRPEDAEETKDELERAIRLHAGA